MRALITGAGKRLGRAIAEHLGSVGYDVAVHYATSDTGAKEAVKNIQGFGRTAVALQADLLDETQVSQLVPDAAEALGGPLTVLINNASIFEYDTIATATRTSWDRHIESNLRAPFVLSQMFAAQAPKADLDYHDEPYANALIVNMLDQRVRKLTPEFMTYTIAKMGLWAFTQTAAQALGPHVRVNGIGPGPTLQGVNQSLAHFEAQRAATILERGVDVEDIITALDYLLLAKTVTGQMIAVDGGQHLQWQTKDVLGLDI
ncbi:MAG: SDR family oxidoreductase [Planktomarina sp.]